MHGTRVGETPLLGEARVLPEEAIGPLEGFWDNLGYVQAHKRSGVVEKNYG